MNRFTYRRYAALFRLWVATLVSRVEERPRREVDPTGSAESGFRAFVEEVKPDLVLHVGAHLAQEAGTYEAHGVRAVVWVEGDPGTAARCKGLLADRSGTSRCRHIVVNALVSDHDGINVDLYRAQNDGASTSIYLPSARLTKHNPEALPDGVTQVVRSKRLSTLLREERIHLSDFRRILIVVDVQGHELAVLRSIDVSDRERIDAAIVELSSVRMYVKAPLADVVMHELHKMGLTMRGALPPIHGDGFFVRRSRTKGR